MAQNPGIRTAIPRRETAGPLLRDSMELEVLLDFALRTWHAETSQAGGTTVTPVMVTLVEQSFKVDMPIDGLICVNASAYLLLLPNALGRLGARTTIDGTVVEQFNHGSSTAGTAQVFPAGLAATFAVPAGEYTVEIFIRNQGTINVGYGFVQSQISRRLDHVS